MGGVVIYFAFMAAIWIGMKLNPDFALEFSDFKVSLFVGGSLIVLLGILHDTVDMLPLAKLMGQAIVGLMLFVNGIRIEQITNPFGGQIVLSQGMSMLLTVAWVVALVNAVNLIDGLDGLAAGVTAISAVVLFLTAIFKYDISTMFLIAAFTGSVLGFLKYNFYPAQIFMGDAGSLFLGFVLSIISILGINKMATTVALLVPITALGIPIYDTFLAILRRLSLKKNIMISDRKHLHYRLLDIGLDQRKVVLFMYCVAVYFGLVSLLLVLIQAKYAVLLLLILMLGVVLGMKGIGFMERKIRRLQEESKR